MKLFTFPRSLRTPAAGVFPREPEARPPGTARRGHSRRKRAIRTLVSAAIAAVLLHLGLGLAAERSVWLRDPVFGDKELKLREREAAAVPGTPRVLMLGTSRTGYGFHSHRIEQRLAADLGRPVVAFNFGVPASGPITHLIYLRRLLAEGHRPTLLLVEVLPSGLAIQDAGPAEHRFISGDRLRRSEVQQAISYGFPADEMNAKWRRSVVEPWYTLRFQILGRLGNGWLPWQYRQDCGRTADSLGWLDPLASDVPADRKRQAFQNARVEYSGFLGGMVPGGGAGRALEDLLALAKEQGIPTRLVVMPESTEFRAMYHPDVADRINRFLTELCDRQGAVWIDARPWLDDRVFYDGHHLLRPGAEAFSDRLVKETLVPFFRAPQ